MNETHPSRPKLVLAMLALVLIGTPLVFILWAEVNHFLLGELDEVNFVLLVPALIAFVVLALVVSRIVRSWEPS